MPFFLKIILIYFFLFGKGIILTTAGQAPDSLLQNLEHSSGLARAHAYNALSAYFMLNKPDTSIVLSRKALYLNRNERNEALEADSRGKIAEAYSYLSQYDSSVMYYMQAIEISERLGDRKKMSSFYNGIGIVLYQLHDYEKAIAYMRQAAELQLGMGEMVNYATITCNVAGVLSVTGRAREAIVLLRDAEKRLKPSGNLGILANLYNTLGSVYQQGFQNIDSAEYYYNKNISLIEGQGLEAFRLAAYRNVGEIYLQKKLFAKAESNFKQALSLSQLLGRRTERIAIYGSLSDLYSAMGNFHEAYEFKKHQLMLHDSVFTEEKEAIVHRLETQYQTEKKDLRIKEQELIIQKEQNQRNAIIFISIVTGLLLMAIALYFWLKKRAKEELEKAKSRIFQNIVHEIRTPLTLITGPVQLLKKELQTDKNAHRFETIEQNADKLITLVNELLLTSRLEKGTLEISYVIGDPVLFTRQLIQQFEPMAREHQVKLIFYSDKPETVISFAASAYEKIVSNLVSNAIKYNRPGGEVLVDLHWDTTNFLLEVKDTGMGMSKKETEKIFGRFYRSPSLKNKPGFGIGLSVVAELVANLGGQVSVNSEPGKGTSMKVTFPLENKHQWSPVPAEHEAEWVLVVEDDKEIYAFIREILQGAGISTQNAVNGAEGFRVAQQQLPDLIITDIMMPVEDGISMTARLKNDELTRHIPVLMLSAKSAINTRLEGMKSGADVYLSKPFHPDELLLLVQNIRNTLKQNRQKFSGELKKADKNYQERLSGNDEYLKKIVETVDRNMLETGFSVNELAEIMCISRSQLHRKITALTGYSTTHFIRVIRLEKAKDLLMANAGNVTEIAYRCGFSSQSYFTKSFAEHFGKAPSDFLK